MLAMQSGVKDQQGGPNDFKRVRRGKFSDVFSLVSASYGSLSYASQNGMPF